MKSLSHPRSLAAKICYEVVDKGQSIDRQLTNLPSTLTPRDRAFIQNLSFGVVRWYWQLEENASTLLKKPIRKKDRVIYFVLLIGIYQIKHLDTAEHAAVADTVDCCNHLNKQWAKGLINACLRSISKSELSHIESAQNYSHPEWIARITQAAWPEHYEAVLHNNNLAAPVCLRVNQKKCSREDYLELLNSQEKLAIADKYSANGIRLTRHVAILDLPKFSSGWVSVQDTASQLVSKYLRLEKGDICLDACAAPGGKTALLLEQANDTAIMHALDIGAARNEKLAETLSRLDLLEKTSMLSGDASYPENWWDGKAYSKILLDAPCTGSGVIRRHPDIKHHRTGEDLDQLIKTQESILDALWKLLKPGGTLLYTTCSIFPKENEKQMKRFSASHPEAVFIEMNHPTGLKRPFGIQTLPGISDMDGFYYCLIQKAGE